MSCSTHKVLIVGIDERRPLGKRRLMREVSIKMDLNVIGWESGVDASS
jgi:hypothetical protein